jgi:hypothetical protein
MAGNFLTAGPPFAVSATVSAITGRPAVTFPLRTA